MKKIYSLLSALALTATTFAASAADGIEFEGTKTGTYGAGYFSANEAIVDMLDDEGNNLYLDFYLSEPGVSAGTFTFQNIDSYSHYRAAGSVMVNFKDVEFTIVGDVETKFELSGSGVLANDTPITFHYSNLDYEPQTLEFSTNVFEEEPYYYGGYNGYTFTLANETKYLKIGLNTGYQFAGTFTMDDCYTAYIKNKDNTNYQFFETLDITISGDSTCAREIHGVATLANGDKVVFDHEDLTETITMSAAGYATYYNPYKAIKVPAGYEAYAVYVEGNKLNLVSEYAAGDVLPAETPVVLHGAPGQATAEYTVASGVKPAKNDLKGTATAEWTVGTDCYFYALALNRDKELDSVGFYWKEPNGTAFINKARRAYLTIAKSANARLGYAFDGTTAISAVEGEAAQGVAFTLAGQRTNAAKDLVIREGKMMFVK